MTLLDKIFKIYPQLEIADYFGPLSTICLQNDGNGDYIAKWNHPTLAQPTQEQLEGAA